MAFGAMPRWRRKYGGSGVARDFAGGDVRSAIESQISQTNSDERLRDVRVGIAQAAPCAMDMIRKHGERLEEMASRLEGFGRGAEEGQGGGPARVGERVRSAIGALGRLGKEMEWFRGRDGRGAECTSN